MKLRLVETKSDGEKIDTSHRRKQLAKIKKAALWCQALSPLDLGPSIWFSVGCAGILLALATVIGVQAIYSLPATFITFCVVFWRSSLPLTMTDVLDSALADYEPLDTEAFSKLQNATAIGQRLNYMQVLDWYREELAALNKADNIEKPIVSGRRFLDRKL